MLKMTNRLNVTPAASKYDSLMELTAKIPRINAKQGGSTNILIMLKGKIVLLLSARLTQNMPIRGTTMS